MIRGAVHDAETDELLGYFKLHEALNGVAYNIDLPGGRRICYDVAGRTLLLARRGLEDAKHLYGFEPLNRS